MKNTISINVTSKAVAVVNGKNKVEVPYVSTAKGVKWYVSKACNRDYIAIGFKVYANGETRANIYLHDYANKLADIKTADGKPLQSIAKATPMSNGKKYTVTNLSPEGLKNFAVMFTDFEKSRQADIKAEPKAKPTAKAKAEPKATPKAEPKAKATAKPQAKAKPTAKPQAKPQAVAKPQAEPKAKAEPKAEAKAEA